MKSGSLQPRKIKHSGRESLISHLLVLLCVFISIGLFSGQAAAQALEQCDVTCTPNTSSSSYSGTVAARPKVLNARGYSSPVVARTSLRAAAAIASSDTTVVGSQSYNYTIPILALPGRAGNSLTLNLYYSSRVWGVDTVNSTVTFNPDRDYPSYGFRLDFGYVETTNGIVVTDGDGTKHALTLSNGTNLFDSTDGTYMEYNTQTNTLTYRLGTVVQYQPFPSDSSLFRPIQITDTNGNFVSIAYVSGHDQLISTITDTVGRVINFNYMQDGSNRLASISQNLHPSGTQTYATFTWSQLYGNGQSWYNFSGLTVAGAPDLNTPLNVLSQCIYANGAGYKFTYGDWGIITKIENLSSSGTTRNFISYNYPLASAGALTDAPAYTQQTISPDGTTTNASNWQYATTKQGTGAVTSLAVTDPNGNVVTTNLDPSTQLLTSIVTQNNSGTTLRTVNYTWTTSDGGTVPATIQTTNEAGQVSSIQYGYDLKWASYGQPTSIQEVDFDGIAKRTTQIAYSTGGTLPGNSAATPYINRHILGLPFNIVVSGASGVKTRADYGYDGYLTFTAVTGAANHDDANYGTSNALRGNLTQLTRWSSVDVHNVGSGGLTTVNSYDTLGNVTTAQVDCCNQKQFNFSATTQYSLADSVVIGPTSGPQFTTSYTWNIDNGLLLTSTDENKQSISYQYDSMNRLIQETPPSPAPQVNIAFGDGAATPTITTSNTGNSLVEVKTFDGLGRLLEVDNKNGSTLISTVTNTYDNIGQRIKSSNPFGPSDAPSYSAYSYDALGRITQISPPTGASVQYQYSGNLITVTDPAGNQRKNYSDALGRLIEVDEPGESYAGIQAKGSIDIGQIKGIATPAKGSVTVNTGTNGEQCTQGVCQTGTVSVSFNNSTETDSASFGSGDTTTSVASKLAAAINNCGHSSCYATATSSGGTVNFTTTGKGSADDSQVNAGYTTDTAAIWSSGSAQTSPNTTGTYLLPGVTQGTNLSLTSPNGRFVLTLLFNQNLVLYDRSTGNPGNIIWQSNTASVNHSAFLYLSTNGNLSLYRPTQRFGTPYWSANTAGATGAYYFAVQNDGNLVVYKGFPQSSFTVSPTQQTLTGGTDAGLVDHGTVTMTAGSFTTSAVSYGPGTANTQGSQVAAALASALSVSGSGVTATSSGTAITVTATTPGTAGNSVAVAVHPTSGDPTDFPTPSFSVSPVNLGGGVDPYSPGFAHPYVTTYTYDGMNSLIASSQAAGNVNDVPAPGQSRSFVYDSLRRITGITTPESGTVSISYTDATNNTCASNPGLPCRITDARGVVKTLIYDAINRLASFSYSDGTAGQTYTYDTGGAGAFALNRLVKITEGPTNSHTYSYDNLGRVTSVSQVVDQSTYLIQYGYNPEGQITSITYPTGRVVSQAYDAIGRLLSIGDTSNTYASGLTFNAAGQTLGITYGNQVQSAFSYNDHLQVSTLRDFKPGSSSDVLNLSYDYGANNNGQIQAIHYFTSPGTEDPTKSEYFGYDPWLRLSSAHTGTVSSTPGTWSLTWGYDRLGNRLRQTLVGGNTNGTSIGQPQFTVDPNTNRITNTGFSYDAAGNLTGDGTNTFAYDAANRLAQVNSGTATYTYFGPLRIKKVTGSTTTVYVYVGSNPVVEYANGTLSKEYVYGGAGLLATLSAGATIYHHPDHLSDRVETDSSGNIIRTYGHAPFGETWYETGAADKWKFTTYERDPECGLDYAKFRYYASAQGRFVMADYFSGSSTSPQSLNRYAYVMNDPVNSVDPLGLAPCNMKVLVNGNLTNDQKNTLQKELNRILSTGGADIHVDLVTSGDHNYTMDIKSSGAGGLYQFGYTNPNNRYASDVCIGSINTVGNTPDPNHTGMPAAGPGLVYGRIFAHEMAAHGFLGYSHADDPADGSRGFLGSGRASSSNLFKDTQAANSVFSLTAQQGAMLNLLCRIRTQKFDVTGGGGGGPFVLIPVPIIPLPIIGGDDCSPDGCGPLPDNSGPPELHCLDPAGCPSLGDSGAAPEDGEL